MELKICCDASVKLEKMSNIINIFCEVESFKIEKDTLNGNIKIYGQYTKDNLEEKLDFFEIVPFTIVFREVGYNVEDIVVDNFTYQEIFNQGVESNFEVFVIYNVALKNDIEIPDNEESEQLKDDINKKYDEVLKKILDSRDDNFLEEKEEVIVEKVEENINTKKEDNNKSTNVSITNVDSNSSLTSKIKDSYNSIRVYYTQKENDIDQISKRENISINKIYEDNKKSDFQKRKRLIIK